VKCVSDNELDKGKGEIERKEYEKRKKGIVTIVLLLSCSSLFA